MQCPTVSPTLAPLLLEGNSMKLNMGLSVGTKGTIAAGLQLSEQDPAENDPAEIHT